MKKARTHISLYGWGMIVLLLLGRGAMNFTDKAVLGLAAMSIIEELHVSPAHFGLVSGCLFWLFALSPVLVNSTITPYGSSLASSCSCWTR